MIGNSRTELAAIGQTEFGIFGQVQREPSIEHQRIASGRNCVEHFWIAGWQANMARCVHTVAGKWARMASTDTRSSPLVYGIGNVAMALRSDHRKTVAIAIEPINQGSRDSDQNRPEPRFPMRQDK